MLFFSALQQFSEINRILKILSLKCVIMKKLLRSSSFATSQKRSVCEGTAGYAAKQQLRYFTKSEAFVKVPRVMLRSSEWFYEEIETI